MKRLVFYLFVVFLPLCMHAMNEKEAHEPQSPGYVIEIYSHDTFGGSIHAHHMKTLAVPAEQPNKALTPEHSPKVAKPSTPPTPNPSPIPTSPLMQTFVDPKPPKHRRIKSAHELGAIAATLKAENTSQQKQEKTQG